MIKYETGSVQNKVRSVALSMSRKAKSVVVGTDVGPVWTLENDATRDISLSRHDRLQKAMFQN